jgi:phosphatidylglycerophosphatase A
MVKPDAIQEVGRWKIFDHLKEWILKWYGKRLQHHQMLIA